MDSKLIGRYEDNSFGSFPGFIIKTISAVFRGIGRKFGLIMALNMYVSITNPILGSSFNILGVTSLIPGAFLFFRELLSSFGESIFMSGICSGKAVILSSISLSG
jgi:hypothetical protein